MTKELSTKTLRKLVNKVLSESNSLTRSKRKAISKIAYMYSNFEEKQLTADNDIDIKTEIVVTSLSTGPNGEDRDFRECDATLSLRKSFGLEDDAEVIAVLNEGQLSALITALMNKYSELTSINREIRMVTNTDKNDN